MVSESRKMEKAGKNIEKQAGINNVAQQSMPNITPLPVFFKSIS